MSNSSPDKLRDYGSLMGYAEFVVKGGRKRWYELSLDRLVARWARQLADRLETRANVREAREKRSELDAARAKRHQRVFAGEQWRVEPKLSQERVRELRRVDELVAEYSNRGKRASA